MQRFPKHPTFADLTAHLACTRKEAPSARKVIGAACCARRLARCAPNPQPLPALVGKIENRLKNSDPIWRYHLKISTKTPSRGIGLSGWRYLEICAYVFLLYLKKWKKWLPSCDSKALRATTRLAHGGPAQERRYRRKWQILSRNRYFNE